MVDFANKTELTCFLIVALPLLLLFSFAVVALFTIKKKGSKKLYVTLFIFSFLVGLLASVFSALLFSVRMTEWGWIGLDFVEFITEILDFTPAIKSFVLLAWSKITIEILFYLLVLVCIVTCVVAPIKWKRKKKPSYDGEGYFTVGETFERCERDCGEQVVILSDDEPLANIVPVTENSHTVCEESDVSEPMIELKIDDTPLFQPVENRQADEKEKDFTANIDDEQPLIDNEQSQLDEKAERIATKSKRVVNNAGKIFSEYLAGKGDVDKDKIKKSIHKVKLRKKD